MTNVQTLNPIWRTQYFLTVQTCYKSEAQKNVSTNYRKIMFFCKLLTTNSQFLAFKFFVPLVNQQQINTGSGLEIRETMRIWHMLNYRSKPVVLKHSGSSRFCKEDPGYSRRFLQAIFSTFFFLSILQRRPRIFKECV